MLEKLYYVINKDVKNENETRYFVVVLRYLSIINALVQIVYIPFFIINFKENLTMALIAFICCISYIGVFYTTYKWSTQKVLIFFSIILVIATLAFTIALGKTSLFEIHLLNLIILIYFSHIGKNWKKIIYATLIGVVLVGIQFVGMEQGGLMGASNLIVLECKIRNIIVGIMQLNIIVYIFSTQTNDTEGKLVRYNEKLEKLASIDPLTSLWNRRKMMEYLEKKVIDYTEAQEDFAIAIGDIDHFKVVNDTYGHDFGDVVLKEISAIIKNYMKDKGKTARWGGEEFLIFVHKVNVDIATELMRELLDIIQKTEISQGDKSIHITMTIGVTDFDPFNGLEETIKKADNHLYMGKTTGRNKVVS